jgi:hypothetical protein
MTTFEQLHPDIIAALPDVKHYANRTVTGRVIEAWTKDENGQWHDTTLLEQELEAAERALTQANKNAAKEATT